MAITRIGKPAIADVRGVNFRNIIINGDQSIAQRGTSTASLSSGANYGATDRFKLFGVTFGTWTMSQSTDVPTGQGFVSSLKMDCTTANGSLSSDSQAQISQGIEGQNLQYIKKGTSSAESLTWSFWTKSNKTGTYICQIRDIDNSRSISKSYTISSADTWEKKIITFPGDTTGGLDNNNEKSFEIRWWLVAGTDFTSGTLATSWASETSANNAVGQVNLADSTSNEWYLTGAQLETGSQASDFEFLPHDVNFDKCERYCQLITEGDASTIAAGAAYSSSQAYAPYQFRKRMRAAPTFTQTTGTGYYRFRNNQSDEQVSSLTFANAKDFTVRINAAGSMTAGDAGWFTSNNASAKILAEAEL